MIMCCYPRCTLPEHLEGDHHIGRPPLPFGALRVVQRFNTKHVPCIMRDDGLAHRWAVCLCMDDQGYAWELCRDCWLRGGHMFPPQITQQDGAA